MVARKEQLGQEDVIPTIDLGERADARGLEVDYRVVSREEPEVRDNRLRIEAEDARHARWRVTAIYIVAIIAVVGLTLVSAYIVLNPNSSPEDEAWARPILASVVVGLLGFVVGTKVSAQ